MVLIGQPNVPTPIRYGTKPAVVSVPSAETVDMVKERNPMNSAGRRRRVGRLRSCFVVVPLQIQPSSRRLTRVLRRVNLGVPVASYHVLPNSAS